jgi:hypothetical protein
MSPEERDVLFRAAIGVIAVDPQEPDWSIPTRRQIPGIRAMHLDAAFYSRGAQRSAEVIPR